MHSLQITLHHYICSIDQSIQPLFTFHSSTKIACGHPGSITNGKVILDNGTIIDPTVYYKCDEGYRLNGPSYRTCRQYGWSGREPSCGEIFDEP